MMTAEATEPRRAYYRGGNIPEIPKMRARSIFLREQQQQQAAAGGQRTGMADASYIRMVVERYLDQPRRLQPPNRLGPKYARRTTFRATDELWEALGFRAEQEETTRSGIIAAALMLAEQEAGA